MNRVKQLKQEYDQISQDIILMQVRQNEIKKKIEEAVEEEKREHARTTQKEREIASEAKVKYYQCGKCGETSSSKDWDTQTQHRRKWHLKHGFLKPINWVYDEGVADVGWGWEFVCPTNNCACTTNGTIAGKPMIKEVHGND